MSHILIFCSSPFSNVICDWNNYEATKTIFCTFGCLSNHVILIATDGRGILLFCNILRYFDFVFCSSLYVCETFNHNLIGEKMLFQRRRKKSDHNYNCCQHSSLHSDTYFLSCYGGKEASTTNRNGFHSQPF